MGSCFTGGGGGGQRNTHLPGDVASLFHFHALQHI